MRSRYLVTYPILLADLAQICCLGPLALCRILSLRLIHAMHALTSIDKSKTILSDRYNLLVDRYKK